MTEFNENVFKYMMVRSPERKKLIDGLTSIKRFDETGAVSQFVTDIRTFREAPDGDAQAIAHANNLLASSEAVLGLEGDPTLGPIGQVAAFMENNDGSSMATLADLEQSLQVLLGMTVQTFAQDENYPSWKERIWNSYCASIVDGSSPVQAQYEGMRGIRALTLIESIIDAQPADSPETLIKSALEVRAALPDGVLRAVEFATIAPPVDEPFAPLSQEQNDTLTKIDQLETAIFELLAQQQKRAERKRQENLLVEDTIVSTMIENNDQVFTPDGESFENVYEATLQKLADAPLPLWRLDQQAIDALSIPTIDLLAEVQIQISETNVGEAINQLETYAATLIQKAFPSTSEELIRGLGHILQPSSTAVDFSFAVPIPNSMSSIVHSTAESRLLAYTAPATGMSTTPPTRPEIRPLGIGDLKIVRQKLLRYEMGEIAHIQNVMKSEKTERTHRRFQQKEDEFRQLTEKEAENERDLTTSKRFELQHEATNTIQEDSRLQLGSSISATFGPVKAAASVTYATGSSRNRSQQTSAQYARNVTERSSERIRQRTLEERSNRTLTEVEESNLHSFDNQAGTDHVIGIYRWLDKIYEAQVYNYGKRMMLEFIVPEPAAFYLYAQANRTTEGGTLSKPKAPTQLRPYDLDRTNYMYYVKEYNATGVTPPPERYKYISHALAEDYTNNKDPKAKEDQKLNIPTGYQSRYVETQFAYSAPHQGKGTSLGLMLGDKIIGSWLSYDVSNNRQRRSTNLDTHIHGLQGQVPIAIHTSELYSYALSLNMECERTAEHFEEWQLETYERIIEAYEQKKNLYEEQLRLLQEEQPANWEFIDGSPEEKRRVERRELKRSCLTLLTKQHFEVFAGHSQKNPPHNYPEIDLGRAYAEGSYIQFFEQSFEWDQMTYQFYPYFWGRKSEWLKRMQIADNDPSYQEFLQAGAARIILPVQPAYNDAILHYLQTGELWRGGTTPVLESELYISIADELKNTPSTDGVSEGTSWEVRIPTKLVMLQNDGTLPTWTSS